ncbi:hypothetical protein [Rhodobacter ferrooxidans]|uniref:hypothetical protein n=1 Tax=Rhodobacter ferrooxidans TaxID=371731 RepID=UPI0018DD997D|nr:hypothetical protein [Rhodobacter sp. SW2]
MDEPKPSQPYSDSPKPQECQSAFQTPFASQVLQFSTYQRVRPLTDRAGKANAPLLLQASSERESSPGKIDGLFERVFQSLGSLSDHFRSIGAHSACQQVELLALDVSEGMARISTSMEGGVSGDDAKLAALAGEAETAGMKELEPE